jgi:apolipoprotein N-acyltransferase
VALVQSNLPLRVKNDAWSKEPGGASGVVRRHQLGLTELAVAHRPELVVWPETSWPDEWVEVLLEGSDTPRECVGSREVGELLDDIKGRWHTDTLLGMNAVLYVPDGELLRSRARFNSAVLVTAAGEYGGRYDKIHRVPFGEYIPLRDWLPFMARLSPYSFDYSIRPGEHLTRFPLGNYHYGILICYEDTVSYLARQYALPDGDQPAADFLLNTSNDGWFDGTAEHAQHLAICRFRAVEARRSVGRAVNMGISAVIDPNGRVLSPSGTAGSEERVWEVSGRAGDENLPVSRWGEFTTVPGVLIASIPVDHRVSPYTRFGDWLAWGCSLVVAVGLVVGFVRRRAN